MYGMYECMYVSCMYACMYVCMHTQLVIYVSIHCMYEFLKLTTNTSPYIHTCSTTYINTYILPTSFADEVQWLRSAGWCVRQLQQG